MKKILPIVILSAAALTSACAPAGYLMQPARARYGRLSPPPSAYGGFETAPPPFGRWDNVMLLPAATPVLALMMDGRQVGGGIVWANPGTLKVRTASGEVELPAADVMRVDRLPVPASRDYVEQGARGAAAGAGFVGVLGLIAGHVPPSRLFAAGAILGASRSIEGAALVRGAVTIYLASRNTGG